MLGAYYYLWYKRPTLPVVGGGIWNGGYTNNPVLGEYNSRDEKVIEKHVDLAKKAGIDFFLINWANADSWDDITLKEHYLKNPKSKEIKFCLHYDSSLTLNRITTERSYDYDFNDQYSPLKKKGEKFLEDFEYLNENYFNHPQYLKIDGRPVVYIYNVSSFRNISAHFDKLKIKGIEPFLVADVVYWAGTKVNKRNLSFLWNNSPKESVKKINRAMGRLSLEKYEKDFSLSKYFDAISGYNMYNPNRVDSFLKNIDALYKKFSDYAKNNNLIFIPNIMPGYDDRKVNGLERPVIDRKEGEFYKDFMDLAQKYMDPSLKLTFITSFNEWHEGTEIEPSKEYGEKYIELTKQFKTVNN